MPADMRNMPRRAILRISRVEQPSFRRAIRTRIAETPFYAA